MNGPATLPAGFGAQASSGAVCEVPQRDGAWWVVIMAFARSKPYYIDVLAGFDAVNAAANGLNRAQYRQQPNASFKRIRTVWAFTTDDAQEARSVAEAIRAMPHAWRRQQVQAVNPQWIDIVPIFIGFPLDSGGVEE
jgi:hypothetical protein